MNFLDRIMHIPFSDPANKMKKQPVHHKIMKGAPLVTHVRGRVIETEKSLAHVPNQTRAQIRGGLPPQRSSKLLIEANQQQQARLQHCTLKNYREPPPSPPLQGSMIYHNLLEHISMHRAQFSPLNSTRLNSG